ncbi:MAG: hypothetical protein ACOYCD_07665 [Kiritimatiellia bacterium]|jgi:hypothetical protein
MQKVKLIYSLFSIITGCCIAAEVTDPANPVPWSKDLAIVSLDGHKLSKSYTAEVRALEKLAEALGLAPEWVDEDIFLPEQHAQCRQYRRILLPRHAFHFTPLMYAGMTRYVTDGGLLISNSSLLGIDKDGDREFNLDKGDTYWPGKRGCFPTLGVYGHSSVTITNVTVVMDCLLSAGLPTGQLLDLGQPINTRKTMNNSAEVVITCNGTYKSDAIRNQPFLTYKHMGNGACIFVAPNLQGKHPWVCQIASNCFSLKTLNWLTLQE